MQMHFLALVALVAVASASPLSDCKISYAAAVGKAKAPEDRCGGLVGLASCLNAAAATMTDTQRLSSQGFFDAARLSLLCPGVAVAQVNLAIPQAEPAVQRERREDTVSIWDISSKYSALANNVVDKESFATLQKAVMALQIGNADDVANLKEDILSAVDARLETLTHQIQTAMETTLSSLKVITSDINDVTMTRIADMEDEINSVENDVTGDINAALGSQNDAITKTINDIATNAGTLSTKITSVDSLTDTKISTTIGDTKTKVDALWTSLASNPLLNKQIPVYRVAVWSTYGQWQGWYASNNAAFFGGVNPSTWTDGNGAAFQMSADKNILRTLFTRKQNGGSNALINALEWYPYSSTNGQMCAALFRIRNTSLAPIVWRTYFYYSSYSGWSETASVAFNGVNQWTSNNNCAGSCTANIDLTIPSNRVSTAIFISSSGPDSGSRSNLLAFYNDCLKLPAGLEYADDLDYAIGGWEQ